jgi:hypothetical protein
VSPATSDSLVTKKTRVPSSEKWELLMLKAPLPPAGPVESSVVAAPERS